MGVFSMFSSNSKDSGYRPPPPRLPNPDPKNFEVKRVKQCGTYLVALVNYPDANNFEGDKVIVFRDLTEPEILEKETLDPHFLENGPILARFVPTDEGWRDAVDYAVGLASRSITNF